MSFLGRIARPISYLAGGAAGAVQGVSDLTKKRTGKINAQNNAMQQPDAQVGHAIPGGMANFYDDSWKQLLGGMQGGQDASTTLTNILASFKGRPGALEDFMQQAAPFIQASQANALKQTDAFKYINDPTNWDKGAMAGYGTGAGQIAQGTQSAINQGQQQLASSGLGRSSASAALMGNLRSQGSAQTADLWSRSFQQAQQNKMSGAMQAMDTHRTLAQMALGMAPTPRVQDEGGSTMGGIMSGVGAGAAVGSALGPIGAGVGGVLGGVAGAVRH